MRRRILCGVVLMLAVLGLCAGAQARESGSRPGGPLGVGEAGKGPLENESEALEAAKVEPLLVRMYNVQDLLLGRDKTYVAPLPPTAGEAGLPRFDMISSLAAGATFGGEPPVGDAVSMTSALSPEVIVEILRRAIDPDSWEEEGGRGRVTNVGALIVVTQTAANQAKIAELLDQFRAGRPLVTIEARWVLVDDGQVAALVGQAGAKRPTPVEVAPAALQQAGAKVIYRGQITCLDRQRVHLATGLGQAYGADAEPVVAERTVGWDLQINSTFQGALLQVTACLTPDGKSATVDLESHISETGQMRRTTLHASGADAKGEGAKAEIDLPDYLFHTFRTTLRVPVDKPILVGGITAPRALDGKVLYLVMEVSSGK